MNKKFLALILVLFTVQAIYAGQLPHNLTAQEKRFVGTIYYDKETTPPPQGPVTAPAEYDEADAVIWAWKGYDTLLKQLIKESADEGPTKVVVSSSSEQSTVYSTLSSYGVNMSNVSFMIDNLDSIWMRDYGPWFVYDGTGSRGIIDLVYNRPRPNDDQFPSDLGSELGISVYKPDLILPGGNLILDGHGVAIMTNVVFDESQGGNPDLTNEELSQIMNEYFGVTKIIMLDQMNDDGTGHVDMFCKLLDDDDIIVGEYSSSSAGASGNYDILNSNAAILAGETNGLGQSFNVHRIPMPAYSSGITYTYTNSLIYNDLVLVPVYGFSSDSQALNVYETVLPGHEVVGINSDDIISANGSIHCISKLIMSEKEFFANHTPLSNTTDNENPYSVTVNITTPGTVSSADLYWSTGSGYNQITMSQQKGSYTYSASIPAQSSGTDVDYYIYVSDNQSNSQYLPSGAPSVHYSFSVIDAPNGITNDFETNDGGFTSNYASGWEWGSDSDVTAHSGSKLWGTGLNSDYTDQVHWTLDIPAADIGDNFILSWYQWRDFEGSKDSKDKGAKTPWDGGNVKISTNGGSTFTLLDNFFTNTSYPDFTTEEEYTGILDSGYENPLAGEETFVGTSNGWKRVTLDLSAYSGQNAVIRFDFGSDNYPTTDKGWYIDDVFLGSYTGTPDPEPEISITPLSIAFGSIPVGDQSDTQTFTISNSGDAALSISSITAPTGFQIKKTASSVWGSSVSTFDISASSQTVIDVRFSPSQSISYTGNITISSNDSDEGSINVSVSGAGVEFNAPTALSASAGDGYVSLNWTPPAGTKEKGLTGYKVYRNSSFLSSSPVASYTDNSVTNGNTYQYYVTAVYTNPAGESAGSNNVSATPQSSGTGGDPFGEPVVYPNNTMSLIGTVTINSAAAGDGDIVAAFSGSELRAKRTVNINQGTAYITLAINVNTNGETINFKVWDSSEDAVLNAPQTVTAQIGGAVGDYPNNLFLINAGSSSSADQTITLNNGWNMISLNVHPNNMGPSEIFADVIDNIVKVKSLTEVYDPTLPEFMNTLTTLADGLGYWVQTDANTSVTITGDVINVSSTEIQLSAGWNLVGYVCQSENDVVTALSSISSELVSAKSLSEVYDPSLPDFMNTLSVLEPGKAYLINVSADCVLTYPDSKLGKIIERTSINNHPFGNVSYKTSSSVVYVTASTSSISNGSVIGAFVNDELRGTAQFTQFERKNYAAVVVNSEIAGEEIEFKVYNASENRVYNINETLSSVPGSSLGKDEFILLSSCDFEDYIPSDYNVKISPNPFNPETSISISLPAAGNVRCAVYNVSGQLVETIYSGKISSGIHTFNWNADKNVSGVYFLRVSSDNNEIIKKMMLLK